MRCGKDQIKCGMGVCTRRNPHECAVAKLHCAHAVCSACRSQPARMRCGKELCVLQQCALHRRRNPHECAVAKCYLKNDDCGCYGRNPHECAVAKYELERVKEFYGVATRTNALWQRRFDRKLFLELLVATRTNALWQRSNICAIFALAAVATRTNALWQRTALRKLQWRVLKSQPARMRCGKGNKPLE